MQIKVRWEQQKNGTCCFKQILDIISYKTVFLQFPTISQPIQTRHIGNPHK